MKQKILYTGTDGATLHVTVGNEPLCLFAVGLDLEEGEIPIKFLATGDNDTSQEGTLDWLTPYINGTEAKLTQTHNMLYIELPGIYQINVPSSENNFRVGWSS